MTMPRIVGHEEWLKARAALLAREKELTHLRDGLARERRQLPWERVDKTYVFDAPQGRVTLADLFGKHQQLLVYHFMFGPDWDEGCKSCSFWADNFNGIWPHLAARDTAFSLISRAPIAKLEAYRKRMGWTLRWVSSANNDFNYDYGVSQRPGEKEVRYNYGSSRDDEELPGISTFIKQDGTVFHTYSAYARGIDAVNGAYQLLDLTAKGRQEEELSFPMSWVRRHDQY